MDRITPTERLPEIDVPLVGGGRWTLSRNAPGFMLMIDVYRGLHCPRCRTHLEALNAARDKFAALGVDLLAVSTDPADRAEQARAEWDMDGVPLAYDLPLETARRLGCYVSQSIRDTETEMFAEPGVFFVRADLTLYGAVLNTFPFARPGIDDLYEVFSVVKERDYPPRGTVAA